MVETLQMTQDEKAARAATVEHARDGCDSLNCHYEAGRRDGAAYKQKQILGLLSKESCVSDELLKRLSNRLAEKEKEGKLDE